MKKVLLTSIIASIFLSFVGCSAKNEVDSSVAKRSMVVEDSSSQTNNSIDQRKALKLYKKYLPKVINLFEDNGLTIKNLNENKDEIDMVSRIVLDDSEGVYSNTESMWFGITYDDDNLISEVGMYIEYAMNLEEIDNDLSFKNTILEDIEKLFFRNETFLNDIKTTVLNYKIDDVSETKVYEYKKGNAEINIGQHKIMIKVNLALKNKK